MDDTKKVYSVSVEVMFNMAIIASSKGEAEEIASESFEEEMGNVRPDIDFSAYEITICPSEFKGILPYGSEQDGERESWTVDKWLELQEVEATDG